MKIFSLNLWLLRIVWLLNKIHKTTWWIDPEVFTLSLTPSRIELNLSMLRSTIKPTVLNNLQYHDEQSCRHQLPTSTNQLPAAMNLGIHRSKSSAYHEFGDCWFPGSEEKIGGTAPILLALATASQTKTGEQGKNSARQGRKPQWPAWELVVAPAPRGKAAAVAPVTKLEAATAQSRMTSSVPDGYPLALSPHSWRCAARSSPLVPSE